MVVFSKCEGCSVSVEVVQYCGGCSVSVEEDSHYCRGSSVVWKETKSTLGIISRVLMVSFNSTEWYPPQYRTPSNALMVSPTVLNIKVLMVSPHSTEHGSSTDHPSQYCNEVPRVILNMISNLLE